MKIWNRIQAHVYIVGTILAALAGGWFQYPPLVFVGIFLAYIAGLSYGEGQNSCAECGTSLLIDDDDDEPDEIPGRKTGLPSFEELKNAMKPKNMRQNSEHKPGNHEPVSTEGTFFYAGKEIRPTDTPRSRYGTDYAVQADGTVETPHDRMYKPEEYDGPRGKCGRPSAQCSITSCGCVDYRMDRPDGIREV